MMEGRSDQEKDIRLLAITLYSLKYRNLQSSSSSFSSKRREMLFEKISSAAKWESILVFVLQ
jgi:hypothetical protein